MHSASFSDFTAMGVNESLELLGVSQATGLSPKEVDERTGKFGTNELASSHTSIIHIFLRQFQSPFIYLLLAAATLALVLGEYIDSVMITAFVLINAILGFFQEFRSEQAAKLLKQYTISHAAIRRGGSQAEIPTAALVPGDIILLEPGDIIPADVRFLTTHNLVVDESVLTGESKPINKQVEALSHPVTQAFEAKNIGFAATAVLSGTAEAVVIATGKLSYMGEVAKLTTETVRVSSFEKGMGRFSQFVLRIVAITLVVILGANMILKGSGTNLIEMIIFAIALATAVIPEALPLVITFSLSRGAVRLAKNKVVVKRLSAIEDLGGIQVLCTDKTGTITQNKLSVHEVYADNKEQTLFYAALSAIKVVNGTKLDSFDTALINGYKDLASKDLPQVERIAELPFDPDRRRSSALLSIDGSQELIVRGATEAVLPHCHLSDHQKHQIKTWFDDQGKSGRRVIAIATKKFSQNDYSLKDEESDLNFLGCVSFMDPLKPSTKEAIDKARELGVLVKIITGDSPEVSGAVAAEVGLIDHHEDVLTGAELEAMTHRDQEKAVIKYNVFARVSPQQKHLIITLLQHNFEVGYLGEGINDAPALKAANVALVVQHASDIAREAADIILLKSSLAVIVNGIEEGREVFANTIKYVKLTLSSNFGNFYAVAIASLFIDFLPMIPIQILLVNLLSDFPLIAVVTDSVDAVEIKKPEGYNLRDFALVATVIGLVSTIFDFLFFGSFYRISPAVLQTNWYMGSILTELVLLYSLRTRKPFFKAGRPSNTIIILTAVAAITTIALPYTAFGQRVFNFTPPTLFHLGIIMGLTAGYFIVTEIVKLMYYKLIPQD